MDDTTGYGPETTTIFTEIDGTFTFYVYHFYGTGSLSESGATVSVYTGEALVPMRTYYVPQGSGRYWNVFVYDSLAGKITDLNKIR